MKRVIVIGGGISGLSTAYLLQRQAKKSGVELKVLLLEKEQRSGGKILSIRDQGYLCEWGPNGFLDNKPQTLDLCRDLGAQEKLLRSNDNARKRFIYSGGMLHQLPENGLQFLKSRLISWPGKARLALEPFVGKPPVDVDETLAAFGRRRLGEEALEKLIAPMVSGIFAGNPETMSLVSCFPRIAELERDFGSLIVAMMKLAKKKKKDIAAGKVVSSAAGPGGVLTSFKDGIQALTDILTFALGEETVRTGVEVTGITKGKNAPYRVVTGGGEVETDAVVLATPAYASGKMLTEFDTFMSHSLAEILYASMTVVCFGYDKRRLGHDVNGFGYLIPKAERMNTLGTLWDSSIFGNRAPAGKVLLRSMLGGACFPKYIGLPDTEVMQRVQNDLKTIMGVKTEPEFMKIFRHPEAIPQYVVGHGERVAHLWEKLQDHPGLFLTGNSYRGIGLNDCVAAAHRAAGEVISHLKNR